MNLRDRLLAGAAATPYAHLLTGRAKPTAAKKADDDADPDKKKDDDEAKAEDEDPDKKKDDDEAKAEDEDPDKKKDDDEAKSEDDDENCLDAARTSGHARALTIARHRAEAAMVRRFQAIFGHGAAGTRPDIAATLFTKLSLKTKEATEILAATAAGSSGPSLAERMRATPQPNVGPEAGKPAQGTAEAAALAMVAAYDKHSGAPAR